MTRRFEPRRAARGASAVRAILQRQIETAIAELPRSAPTDEDIHAARKHAKAARATLRLLRPLLTTAAYRGENRTLRDAARALSAARDDAVLLKTLSELTQRTKGSARRRRLATFRDALHRDAGRRRAELERHRLRETAARLRRALSLVASLPALPRRWQPVYAALRATYRKGRSCARRNARRASGTSLHEWRKRAKYLRSQLEVLAPEQDARVQAISSRLHKLSDRLGEEHDLAVLAELARDRAQAMGRNAHAALQKQIEKRRRKMRKRALKLGLPLYAEKPRRFESRLRRHLPGG